MKVEELMIGDWYWWEAEGKKYPLQVTKDTFKLMDEDISNFQRIPITKNILKKNGFEKNTSNTKMIFNTHEHRLIYDLTDRIFTIFNEIEGTILVQKSIVNIHELQHALKLCEINKEIIV